MYLANEAKAIGRGGISEVSKISGVSRVTISEGMKEIKSEGDIPPKQKREAEGKAAGGNRRKQKILR